MELALQVVGLKMTGKIEDVKDIAMRIVGNSGSDASTNNGMTTPGMMNLSAGSSYDYRRLLLTRVGDPDFERLIIDSLSTLDIRGISGEPVSLKHIISYPTKTGQTLLHLAVALNLPSLVESLIERDINLDAQDYNGYTALHFAVVFGSNCCARQLINAGANLDIRTKHGRTALELAPEGFFREPRTTAESPAGVSDDESHFGDNEDESDDETRSQLRGHLRRRNRRPHSRRSSMPASVASDESDVEHNDLDDDNATIVSPEGPSMTGLPGKDSVIDDKQAASFAEYLQRAWSQFQPPQLVPQMPGMAWAFPVFVPMVGWPAFRGDKHGKEADGEVKHAAWERWTAQMGAALARQNHLVTKADSPVGVDLGPGTPLAPIPTPVQSRYIFRRSGRGQQPPPVSEKEVNAYTYRSNSKSLVKAVKKGIYLVCSTLPFTNLILYRRPHASFLLDTYYHWYVLIWSLQRIVTDNLLTVAIIWAFFKSYPIINMLKQEFPMEEISV